MFLGMVPAAIVGVVAIAAFVTLLINIEFVVALLTPFADDWGDLAQGAARVAAGVALVVASIFVILNTYTAVTLMVGDAFYRKIATHVDESRGAPASPASSSLWKELRRGVGEGLRVLVPTVGLALLVFALGFIPLVGSVTAATAGALLGGWLLVVELSSIPFEARGMHLTARRHTLRQARARSVGFGAATYLIFLIPFGAIIAMPAAVAGATLLTRSLLGEDTHPAPVNATEPDRLQRPPHG